MKRRTVLGSFGAMLTGGSALSPAFAATGDIPLKSTVKQPSVAQKAPYKILVGGLPDGQTDHWANRVAAGLQDVLSPQSQIRVQTIGGRDGVTSANRLQTLVGTEGHIAAMLPGETAIAFLTGDPRVHFQPGEWIPVMAGVNSGIIVVRGGLSRLSKPVPIRLAMVGPESKGLAAILVFDKLGVPIVPIFGLRGAAALRAFALGEADALMLTGEQIPINFPKLREKGGLAICSLGGADDREHAGKEPQFMNLPTVEELAATRGSRPLSPLLEQAYRAVVAASRIEFILVLPHLTPPAVVALWRQAALSMIRAPAVRSTTAASSIRLTEVGAAAAIAPLIASADAMLALRQMLFKRFGWRPS